MTKDSNCTCRHGAHPGTRCFWESPGGDLVGQFCTCESYEPCSHPSGATERSSLGSPICPDCNQYFPREDSDVA